MARRGATIFVLIVSLLHGLAGEVAATDAGQAFGPAGAQVQFFDRAFSPDFVATADDSLPGEAPRPVKIFFRVSELGHLVVVSGKVVAADIFVSLGSPPFDVAIPNGRFPVRLAVLQGSMGRGRVTFARVDLSDVPAVRWAPAYPEGHRRDVENPNEAAGYEVSSGLGAFFDPEAGKAALAAIETNDDLLEAWLDEGQIRGMREKGSSGFRLVKDSGPANIVVFDTGWGDGTYATWVGYDAAGNPVTLLTDFDVLDWSKVTE
ncbi:MAG: DUF4241 domain-containing protein [Hyphomicrobium sp.]|nr:DUF4241 domain-containing protein [Hyphomicrobium sp.]